MNRRSERLLFAEIGGGVRWLVHGGSHHHNILRSGDRYIANDPKHYRTDRENDVPAFLWNPSDNRMEDAAQAQRRIKAVVALGLDEFRTRAWA